MITAWTASRSRTAATCRPWWPACRSASRSTLAVVRDGKPQTLQVTIEEQPQEFGTAGVPAPRRRRSAEQDSGQPRQGRRRGDRPDAGAGRAAWATRTSASGAVITEVEPDGLAAAGGPAPRHADHQGRQQGGRPRRAGSRKRSSRLAGARACCSRCSRRRAAPPSWS